MNTKWFHLYIKLFQAGKRIGCHQLPERSFHIGNWQFPVCARCTGVLIGQVVMAFGYIFSVKPFPVLGLLFLMIMFTDWFVQYIGWIESNNIRRFVTGFLAGMGLIIIYVYGFSLLLNRFLLFR